MLDVIDLLLVIIGIIFLSIGAIFIIIFIENNRQITLRNWWIGILAFIIFFIIGYILITWLFLTNHQSIKFLSFEKVVSLILFFGSIFVLLIISLLKNTTNNLLMKEKELAQTIKKLEKNQLDIENKIKSRTEEANKLNKFLIGRELKMIELKDEIKKLKKFSNSETKL